jgi:hypothetical protein
MHGELLQSMNDLGPDHNLDGRLHSHPVVTRRPQYLLPAIPYVLEFTDHDTCLADTRASAQRRLDNFLLRFNEWCELNLILAARNANLPKVISRYQTSNIFMERDPHPSAFHDDDDDPEDHFPLPRNVSSSQGHTSMPASTSASVTQTTSSDRGATTDAKTAAHDVKVQRFYSKLHRTYHYGQPDGTNLKRAISAEHFFNLQMNWQRRHYPRQLPNNSVPTHKFKVYETLLTRDSLIRRTTRGPPAIS